MFHRIWVVRPDNYWIVRNRDIFDTLYFAIKSLHLLAEEKQKLHLVQQELAAEQKKRQNAERKFLDLQRSYQDPFKQLEDKHKKSDKAENVDKILRDVKAGMKVTKAALNVCKRVSGSAGGVESDWIANLLQNIPARAIPEEFVPTHHHRTLAWSSHSISVIVKLGPWIKNIQI